MECNAIGAFQGAPKDFVDFVVKQDPDGSCQDVKVGGHSPGPVLDDEILARFVFCPAHVAKNNGEHGQINESLFADVTSIGGSVNRLLDPVGVATDGVHEKGESIAEGVRSGGPDRSPQPDRQYLGVVKLAARDVRAIAVDPVARRLRVYDTSRGPNDPLHGDVVANITGLDKASRKALRVKLYSLAIKSGLFVSPNYAGAYDLAKCGLDLHSDQLQTSPR